MEKDFKGIFTALTTPFKDEAVSLADFRENITRYNDFDLTGYVIGGSTGESVYLSDEECIELVKTARETAGPGKKIIAGSDRESTRNTVDFTNRMADLGIDAALVCLPCYYKSLMTPEALKTHYLVLAEKARIPIIIYSIPRNTGINPPADVLISLTQHPNILGIKDSSGNLSFCEEILPLKRSDAVYLLGAGSIIFPGLIMGASGGILTLAAVAPDLCTLLYKLFQENKWDEAKQLQSDLVPLNHAVTRDHGVPAAKFALDQRGYFGGSCRLPLLPPTEEVQHKVTQILEKLKNKYAL